jgi:hypothetical protein
LKLSWSGEFGCLWVKSKLGAPLSQPARQLLLEAIAVGIENRSIIPKFTFLEQALELMMARLSYPEVVPNMAPALLRWAKWNNLSHGISFSQTCIREKKMLVNSHLEQ